MEKLMRTEYYCAECREAQNVLFDDVRCTIYWSIWLFVPNIANAESVLSDND